MAKDIRQAKPGRDRRHPRTWAISHRAWVYGNTRVTARQPRPGPGPGPLAHRLSCRLRGVHGGQGTAQGHVRGGALAIVSPAAGPPPAAVAAPPPCSSSWARGWVYGNTRVTARQPRPGPGPGPLAHRLSCRLRGVHGGQGTAQGHVRGSALAIFFFLGKVGFIERWKNVGPSLKRNTAE